MKCQNCGKHTAVFHYQSNINGAVTEQHLCQECAQTMEGSVFAESLAGNGQMFKNGFFGDSIYGDGMFGSGLFGYDFGLRPTLNRFFEIPAMTGGFMVTPAPRPAAPLPERGADNIPADAGEAVKKRRELNRLRNELQAAVAEERYERAAELRDQIYKMEKD